MIEGPQSSCQMLRGLQALIKAERSLRNSSQSMMDGVGPAPCSSTAAGTAPAPTRRRIIAPSLRVPLQLSCPESGCRALPPLPWPSPSACSRSQQSLPACPGALVPVTADQEEQHEGNPSRSHSKLYIPRVPTLLHLSPRGWCLQLDGSPRGEDSCQAGWLPWFSGRLNSTEPQPMAPPSSWRWRPG